MQSMKMSELTPEIVLRFIKVEEDEDTIKDMELILPAAKAYISDTIGLTAEEIDRREDITLAAVVLCQHMHDNRTFVVDSKEANRVIENILGLHDHNLVG